MPLGVRVVGNNRLFVVHDWVWAHTWREVSYRHLMLLNRELSFDIDLSGVGCGCNAAVCAQPLRRSNTISAVLLATDVTVNDPRVYLPHADLVQMRDPHDSGSNYCDIQGYEVDGDDVEPCLEIDLLEGNRKAIQTTLHTRSGHGADGHGCNQDGCYANLGKMADESSRYGPGIGALGGLDSLKPIHVSATFATVPLSEGLEDAWNGARLDVTLSQEHGKDGSVTEHFFDATSVLGSHATQGGARPLPPEDQAAVCGASGVRIMRRVKQIVQSQS